MNKTRSKTKDSFSSFSLSGELLKAIKEMGFKHPTPIQNKVIPHLMSSDQDLIASAQTGTGKTAAFGLPLLSLTNTQSNKVQTLILCPTRELCIQITNDLSSYSKYLRMVKLRYISCLLNVSNKEIKKGIIEIKSKFNKDIIFKDRLNCYIYKN